ncbi:MAG: aminotransferase class I/II-fold pyridoxal phosphate-dependent enzyme, partial [Sediminibacterium sp.]|nr:aminotransferase class I/II-fold pyridoxal phosphate-dependent enzyme [Sediminibacterium sp.]
MTLAAIQSKLPDVGTTIFTVMSQLAVEHNAVNLGQGFPDFSMSGELRSLVSKAMKDDFNQYVHMAGLPALRAGIAEKTERLYKTGIDPETQVTVTPGGTYAIYTALTTVLQPGDEVIVFEPAYDSYVPNIEINGAKAILIPLQFPAYSVPWDEVRARITAKTKMIMINSPHNPTGSVLSAEDIEALRSIVTGTNILILSDEVYEHLIFDGIEHQSILRYPDLLERSFVCSSFGKTYHCTGWKLGYCISSPALMKEFRKVHQFNCFSCDTPKQVAIAEYIKNETAYRELGPFLQKKRDLFRELMKATPFECIPSHGS